MATEEDNFDIDIYGDGGGDYQEEGQVEQDEQPHAVEASAHPSESAATPGTVDGVSELMANGHDSHQDTKIENNSEHANNIGNKIGSTDEATLDPLQLPKQAPQVQGLKRKEGADDRFVDPGATTALFISDLHWWITDDDIRGWANQSQCEDELEDMTFSEHKVNGKSKGQAYVLFKSPQAATAAKHKIESFGEGQKYRQKFTVSYTNPYTNPFKTLPKDGPMRNGNQTNRSSSGGYNNSNVAGPPPVQSGYNSGGNFRGRGGGYNNRGSMSNMGSYNRGGFQQSMTGGYQAPPINGFQGSPMTGMPQYGNFQNRGNIMGGGMRGGGSIGMRGGRGGMSPNGMMGMPMGGMQVGMGVMPGQMGNMGMGIPQMGAGMGMQGRPPYFTSAVPQNYHQPMTGLVQPSHISGAGAAPVAGAPIAYQSSGFPTSNHPASAYPAAGYTVVRYPQPASGTSFTSPSVATPATPNTPDSGIEMNTRSTLNYPWSAAGSSGFQGAQPHYNPAFFPQQQGGQQGGVGDSSWNPHGAKRTRQE